MPILYFVIHSFTDNIFHGNPAGVCPLDEWLDDDLMQQIARENNLSETAFFVRNNGEYDLRWFTPTMEVDLCGHATLASSFVLFSHLDHEEETIKFNTKSGKLVVWKEKENLIMDFPSRPGEEIEIPEELVEGLGSKPECVLKSRDFLAIFESEEQVRELRPDFEKLLEIDCTGVIATAPGSNVDFVSRFFAPQAGIDEDPVTGSAHSTLTPYWADRLGKTRLAARQISERGGELWCKLEDDRVQISGKAVLYLKGFLPFG